MSKQTVNIGTSANDRTGDNLRTAFNKINENFNELYVALGLGDTTLNLGAFTFTGSVLSTDDSTNITIDRPTTVNGEIVVDGDITPKTNLGSNLGTPTKRFKELYLSGNTIYLGNTSISVNANGDFLLGGQDLSSVASNNDQTLNTTDEVAFAAVSVGNLRVAPTGNGVELSNGTNDIIITSQDDFSVTTTTGDINLNTTAGSVGIDATGGLLQMQGQNGVDISSALGDIDLNAFSNNIVFKSPVVGLIGDLTGSVFADDSTLLVDGVNGSIPYSVISDVQVTESDLLVDWAGIVGTQIQTNGLPINTFTNGDLEVRGTLSFDTGTADFADTSIQNFAPGNVYANSGQFLYVTGKHAGGTATNVAFTYDTNINNPRQTFYGKTEFAFNGQTPVVDFGNATISNWTDPNVVNTGSGGAAVITIGTTNATMDYLTIRIVENSPGDIDVEFNYNPPSGSVSVSANGDNPNRFGGTTLFAAGNTTWTTMNILDAVGDKGDMTIVDHSSNRIYRVTTIAKVLPAPGFLGDAHCVIERLK